MSAPTTHDPFVVSTQDGASWVRRALTRDGHGLYALAGSAAGAPTEVLATIPELAADHGLRSMADALPMPVGQEPRTLDQVEHELAGANLSLYEEELETARLRLALASAQRGRREQRARAAALLAERHTTNEVLSDVAVALRERETSPLTVYRASHDSIVMGLYTTAAEARKHCETLMRRDLPTVTFDWIEDEEDGVAELVAAVGDEEHSTGYVVTALAVTSAYDPDADE